LVLPCSSIQPVTLRQSPLRGCPLFQRGSLRAATQHAVRKGISELLAKADAKVSVFEAAVKNAKPGLDRIDTKYATNYLDGAATAHLLISKAIKNGPTAYALVGVLTTPDDLSLNAASGSAFL
jgi:hypothetical protein